MADLIVHRVRRNQSTRKEELERFEQPSTAQVMGLIGDLDDYLFPAVILGQTEAPWTDELSICIVGRFEYWHAFAPYGSWQLDLGTDDNTEERFWDACEIFCARKNVTKRIENLRLIVETYSSELTLQSLATIVYLPDDPRPPATCEGQLSLFNDTDAEDG